LKLIPEVYEMFTYPSREGPAHSVARLCNTQAVSLLYLQTMYVQMTVLIGQRNYEAEFYNKHTEVVEVSKHQGVCGLCYMTQIIVNSAKFSTALNATKTAHCSSHLLQKKILMVS